MTHLLRFPRYDEWVRSDRIVAVVDRPDMTKLKKKALAAKSPKVSIHCELEHTSIGREVRLHVTLPGASHIATAPTRDVVCIYMHVHKLAVCRRKKTCECKILLSSW